MLLATTEVSNLFVCALGIGTVFLGLVCLIVLCKIIGLFCNKQSKPAQTQAVQKSAPATVAAAPIENKQEIIAAVSAAIAEELGTDVSAIKITSFKKL